MADILTLRKFEALGPFEIKDELIESGQEDLADDAVRVPECRPRQSQLDRHHAARGLFPARPVRHHGEQARDGASRRDRRDAAGQAASRAASMPGSPSTRICPAPSFCPRWCSSRSRRSASIRTRSFTSSSNSIIGDNYPVPDRMLVHNERIVHEYLMWAMCGKPRPTGKFDLYAVEGGTAAMCYIFKSLKANRLLSPRRHHRARHADLHALSRDDAPGGLRPQGRQHRGAAGEPLPIHRRGDQEARRSEDQGVLHRQSGQPDRHGDEQGDDRKDRRTWSRPSAPT